MYALMGLLLTAATIALVCWVRDSARTGYLVIYVLLMGAGFILIILQCFVRFHTGCTLCFCSFASLE